MQRFAADVIVRMDCANDGVKTESHCPQLTRQQCKRTFTETIHRRFKKELTGIVIAQKSTTKGSGVTLAQQCRWHTVRGFIALFG